MKTLKKLSKKKITYIVIILIVFLGIFFFYNETHKQDIKSEVVKSESGQWTTYFNYEYGFSIDFPEGWEINEDYKNVSPTINIFMPNKKVIPPFDHFADINNVSIYPKGLPTEAVIGQSKTTDIDLDYKFDKSIDYILEDGSAWATYINFEKVSDPWKPWGFLWAKTVVNDIEYKCLRSGKEIELDNCNPFEDDEFVRMGVVDSDIREIQEKIIRSFKFI